MDEEKTIIYLNNNEIIIKFNYESNKRFNQRLTFIKILEKNNFKWKDALKLSKVWYNIKFNSCKYQSELYNQYLKYNKEFDKININ
jgi:hypothetical protein